MLVCFRIYIYKEKIDRKRKFPYARVVLHLQVTEEAKREREERMAQHKQDLDAIYKKNLEVQQEAAEALRKTQEEHALATKELKRAERDVRCER